VPPIQFSDINYAPSQPLSKIQQTRSDFYLSLLKLTRLIGGSIIVADTEPSGDGKGFDEKDIGAILLWLPPGKRLHLFRDFMLLYRSGFISLIRKYGLRGFYRINFVFEGNVESMFAKSVPSFGCDPAECGFVQMVAINPSHAGKGHAAALLAHQMHNHFEEFPNRPVILDTTTVHAIRVYEKMGFKVLEERKVATGTDSDGIRLKVNVDPAVKAEAEETCIQRVMIKIPEVA
jgi:ribosomal protein S18 acetylase RimI-like enzyme